MLDIMSVEDIWKRFILLFITGHTGVNIPACEFRKSHEELKSGE